jgi:CDGSH-type Zn-finger protein
LDALRATLCRCGASASKPYCDGSHVKVGFAATGEPKTLESSPLEKRDGPLRITPTRDGPLHAEGSLEIVSGTGRTVTRGADAWLCRCGHSQNKPFCDGSHAKAGFRAEP